MRHQRVVQLILVFALILSSFASSLTLSVQAAPEAVPPRVLSNGTVPITPGPEMTGQELPALRTRTSHTYLASDGTYQAQIFSGSINYQDANGAWKPIDNTLVPGGDKGVAYQNKANHYQVQLPPTLQAPVRISAGDAWVAFSLKGAGGKVSAKDNTAIYTDALPGLDVTYEASNDLVKESVILHSATANPAVTYDLQISPGLRSSLNAGGGLDVGDEQGQVLFSLEKPFMVDAAGTPSDAVSFKLDQASGGNALTVTADPAWLADSARKYPVVIDPTVTINPVTTCTLNSSNPTTSYCSSSAVAVGRDSGTGSTGRSLLQFNVQGAVGDSQVRVLQAQMGLYGYQSPTASSTAHVEIHRVTKAWTSNATWNTYDGTHTWTSAGGDYDPSVAYSSDINWQQAQAQWQWWFPTDLVQGWVDGSIANQGMLLKTSTESGSNRAIFTSVTSTDTAHWPYLTVIYYPWVGNLRYWTFDQQQLTDHLTSQVNVANGNLLLHQSDLTLQGTGLPLPLDQTYNSRVLYAGFHLGSWAFGTGDEILLSQYPRGDREFYGPSRYGLPFISTGSGTYRSPNGLDATLKDSGSNTFALTFNKTGVKYTFSESALSTITDQNSNTISFSYDSNGHLTGITDTQGRVTSVSENAGGFITQITDPAGRTIQYGYDGNNNLTSVTDANGKQYQYAYSGYDLTQVTDPKGNITTFSYDSKHRVTSLTRVTNVGAGTGPTWTYTYNTGSTVETDPNNHQTTYYYDPMGRVNQTKDALNHNQSSSYTANSDVQSYTDAAGAVTNFSYDAINNVTQAKLPTGAATNLAYADSAHPYYPSSQTDGQGNSLSYTYDAKGNLIKTTDGLASQNQTNAAYNGNGTLASVTDPRGSVGGVATTTSYGYDAKGNLTSITPPTPLGGTTITRDSVSRISSVTDGKGQTTSYTYDNLDRITQITYQGGSTISYSYDDNGNLTSLTDNTGTTSFSYDALNRMTSKTLPSLSTISYGYDDVGNLTSLTDSSGTTLYGYDAVNRLTSLTDPNSQQTTFGYDANNRRTTTSYPNGVTITQGYDNAGRLTSIVGKNGSGTVLTSFSYSYTNPATGKDSSLRYSVTDASGNKTSYTYDVLNRLTEAKTTNSGGTTISDYQYSYDAIGNRISQTVNGTTTSFTYNAANELTTSGFSFDANGNQTASNSGLAMSYNTKNQTASVTPPGSGAISMSYTGASQVERVTAGSTNYTHSTLGLDQETAGSSTTAYTRDNQGTLVSERTPSGTYYYLFDGLGSAVALTDSTGAVKNTYSYDPYGRVTASTGSVANPYRFGGAYGAYTDSSGLSKIGQRYYDSSLGRWTQQDLVAGALSSPMSLNRYAYAGCNPVTSIDPTGTVGILPPVPPWARRCTIAGDFNALNGAIVGTLGGPAGIPVGIASGFLTGCLGEIVLEKYGK